MSDKFSKNRMPGSEIFGTQIIKTDEAVLLAKVMKAEGAATNEIVATLSFFDDLLFINRSASLINNNLRRTKSGRFRKNASHQDLLERRLESYIDEVNEF